jgi:hypothetical protein
LTDNEQTQTERLQGAVMMEEQATNSDPWFTRLPTVSQIWSKAVAGTIPLPWVFGALVMLFPVGLFFVWQHPQWATRTKWIWTGGWAAAFAVGMWLVAPLLIFLTLLGAFAVALLAIWSSSTLALDKKKLATGGAVGGLLLCLFVEFAFFSIRAYNAEEEEQRKKYAEQAVLDKEKARQKEEAVRQKLTEGNQAWSSGDKVKAVALYRECIELGLSRSGETSTVYQRVIEQDVSSGDLSAAKALIRQARQGSVELAFTDPKCNDLLREVEAQIAEKKRAEGEGLTEDFYPRKSGASWYYVHELLTPGAGGMRTHIQYDFISKNEIEKYAKLAEGFTRDGREFPLPFDVERTTKDTFTGTMAIKRDGKLLLVKSGKNGGWEPWLKIDARVGESWDGEKAGNIQIRYRYKERGTHKGVETVVIVKEMTVDGITENLIERVFAKNIGLLSAESYHDKGGSRVVTYRLVIHGLEKLDGYMQGKGNLTNKERLFFK